MPAQPTAAKSVMTFVQKRRFGHLAAAGKRRDFCERVPSKFHDGFGEAGQAYAAFGYRDFTFVILQKQHRYGIQ
jgi:hypothetical protein